MVIELLIERILDSTMGFRNDRFYIPVLFYADDGLILVNGLKQAIQLIRIVTKEANRFGLNINRAKSNCLIFNAKDSKGIKEIEGISVVEEIRYLGIKVNVGRDCFNKHKKDKISQAKKMIH